MIVVGIDPGSGKKRHGVAVYKDGKLFDLAMMSRNEIIESHRYNQDCFFSIENVCYSNPVHANKKTGKNAVDNSIGRRIGMCQQAQLEIVSDLDFYGIPYVLHKPSSKWKDVKEIKEFERITKWYKSSNKDTRSAAYFGYLKANK